MHSGLRGCVLLAQCALIAGGLGVAGSAPGATFSVLPSAIDNSYTGTVALQVGGLTNGETVIVQKFIDGNTNSLIDAADPLVQQLRLTDNQATVIGGVTNANVPYDSNATSGTITSLWRPLDAGVGQVFVGRYLYRLTSPTARFAAVTNLFVVTNAAYGQSFTGTVHCGATNIPYAQVVLLAPPTGEGGGEPVAGTVADAAGHYTIKAAPGSYMLWPFRTNYLWDTSLAQTLTLGAGATVSTNLNMLAATRTISGRLADAANAGIGLPGALLTAGSEDGLFMFAFTGTNGDFVLPVSAGGWNVSADREGLAAYGYLAPNSEWPVDTTTGDVAGVTLALPKATALVHGAVKVSGGQPIPGARLWGDDEGHQYEVGGSSGPDGRYVIAVIAGAWRIGPDDETRSAFSGYLFPQSDPLAVGDGQAVLLDIVALPATNRIGGHVRDTAGQPVTNVSVGASAEIGGTRYGDFQRTDGVGHYSLQVGNGAWDVWLDSDGLRARGYLGAGNRSVVISNGDVTLDFTVLAATNRISGHVRDNGGQPVTNLSVGADIEIGGARYGTDTQTDESGYYELPVANGTWRVWLDSDGLGERGYLGVDSRSVVIANNDVTLDFTLLVADRRITGTVRESGGSPVTNLFVGAGADIGGTNWFASARTDGSGHYDLAVASGTWDVWLDSDGLNERGYLGVENGSAVISNHNVVLDFTVLAAGYRITGTVLETGGRPVTNLSVGAGAEIGGRNYFAHTWTDDGGHYALSVAPGTWDVWLDSDDLTAHGYLNVWNRSVVVSNGDVVVDFTVMPFRAPVIAGLTPRAGGRFDIMVNGSEGMFFSLEYSTNLVRSLWAPLLTTNLANGLFTYAANPTDRCGFYRLAGLRLLTPYVNEADMASINEAFSADASAPWGFAHGGVDFMPNGELKPFQAAAPGVVQTVQLWQNGSNWQVNVTLRYDARYWLDYTFEPMSSSKADGDLQLSNIVVSPGQTVAAGAVIGYLHMTQSYSHVHFGVHDGSDAVCPDPYFTEAARQSVLNVLHGNFPGANLCY